MHHGKLGQGEIRCFTGLRGCAAVLVMCYHFSVGLPNGAIPMQRFLAHGYLWVDLFFILSGFVMAYSQALPFERGYALRAHGRFLVSRLARVYPLYAIVIIESACLLAWRTGHLDAAVLGCNLAMVQGWGLANSLEGAAWSVSTEWAAYLLFPVLLGLAVLSTRQVAAGVALAAAAAVAWLAFAPGPFTFAGQARHGPLDLYSAATAAPLLRCLSEFTLGLLSFRAGSWLAAQATLRRHSGAMALLVTLLLLFLLTRPGSDVVAVGLFCALLVFLSQQNGALAAALGSAVPYQIGRWSYSIYLIHDKFSHPAALMQRQLAGKVPEAPLVTIAIGSVIVIGCSALTFIWVEQKLRRWAMRLSRPLRESAVNPLPSPLPSLEAGT